MNESIVTLGEMVRVCIPVSRRDNIRQQQTPNFIKRRALIGHIYKDKPIELSSQEPPLPEITPKSIPQEHRTQCLYYTYERARRMNRKLRTLTTPVCDEAELRQRQFRQGSPINSGGRYFHSSLPESHIGPELEEYTRMIDRYHQIAQTASKKKDQKDKRDSTKAQYKRTKFVADYQVKSQVSRVDALLSQHEKRKCPDCAQATCVCVEDQWISHARNLSTRSAISRRNFRKEIQNFNNRHKDKVQPKLSAEKKFTFRSPKNSMKARINKDTYLMKGTQVDFPDQSGSPRPREITLAIFK